MPLTKQHFLLALLCLLPIVGLIDTAYLSYKAFSGGSVVCNLLNGCSVVLHSPWATLFEVPTALYGFIYYGVLALFAISYMQWADHVILQLITILSTVGLLFSLWLVYVQVFQLGAICEYCMISAGLSALIVISAWLEVGRVGWYKTINSN